MIDEEKIAEKNLFASKELSPFLSNPDAIALNVDKQMLNVFLSVWLSDSALSSRAIATKIYDVAIRRVIFLLGYEGLAAAEALYDSSNLKHKDTESSNNKNGKEEHITPELAQQIAETKFLQFISHNIEKIKNAMFSEFKKRIKPDQLPLLKNVIDEYALQSISNFYSLRELMLPADADVKYENRWVIETKNRIDDELYELKFFPRKKSEAEKRLYDTDKVRLVSLFNKLFDLNVQYNRATINILHILYENYGIIIPSGANARGKQFWLKEPKFALIWQQKRSEMFDFFENEFKKTSQNKVSDLLSAYDTTLAHYYSSEKVLEFYALPIAIAKKYPAFVFAFDPNKYYSEVVFDSLLPSYLFKA